MPPSAQEAAIARLDGSLEKQFTEGWELDSWMGDVGRVFRFRSCKSNEYCHIAMFGLKKGLRFFFFASMWLVGWWNHYFAKEKTCDDAYVR